MLVPPLGNKNKPNVILKSCALKLRDGLNKGKFDLHYSRGKRAFNSGHNGLFQK